jgi:hypothetical protein
MAYVRGELHIVKHHHDEDGDEVDPDYGFDLGHGVDNTLPPGPPGVFPPLSPSHPIQPAPPGTPPGTIWPPFWAGPRPGHELPSVPGHPSQGLPVSPGHPSTGPVPPDASTKPPSQTYWVVVGIPGIGWRYCAVDPSLSVGYPLPPSAAPK